MNRWIVVVLTFTTAAFLASCSTNHSPSSNSAKGSSRTSVGSSGNTGTSTQVTAPPGSTQSFSDGYVAALRNCITPTDNPEQCQLIPNETSPMGDDPFLYCQNLVRIGNGVIGSDVPSEWYAGCEGVVSKASFGSGGAGSTGSASPPTTTSTTNPINMNGLSPQQQAFVTDIFASFPGMSSRMATFYGGTPYSTQMLVTSAQAACSSLQLHIADADMSGQESDYSQAFGAFNADIPGVDDGTIPYATGRQNLQRVMAIVIKDLCPTFSNVIPPS